jgi:hypothetical protein
MRRRPLILALAVGLLAAAVLAGSATAGGKRFALALDSANEAPAVPAGVTASGPGTLTINPGTGEVCFFFSLSGTNIGTIFAAHIHEAAVGQPGPIVVPLALNGCVTSTDRAQLIEVFTNPGDYYVNVHSRDSAVPPSPSIGSPSGVARDQLSHSH